MKRKEGEFWAWVYQQTNPEWDIRIGRTWAPGQKAERLDCCVYAVDVASGWVGCAAMPRASVGKMAEAARKSVMGLGGATDAAGQLVHEAAMAEAEAGSPDYEATMTVVTLALSTTRTYEMGQATAPSKAQHWLYLVYACRNGTFVARPAMVRSEATSLLLPTDVLGKFIGDVVALDLKGGATEVGRSVRDAGGAEVGEMFRRTRP